MDQPLQRFCLSSSYLCDPVNVKAWLVAATQHRVEHLDFDYTLDCIFDLPTAVLTCKTLVVFKLSNVHLSSLKSCSVDLRPLKILHLNSVTFSEDRDLAELLSGSPNLEDLEVSDLYFESYVVGTKFTRLAKLVRAHIFTPEFPLEVVNNVQFLRINWMDHQCLIPEFRNLTHLKFGSYIKGLLVLDLIKHCPKLQILVIYKCSFGPTPRKIPLQMLCCSSLCDLLNVNAWVTPATQCRIEQLNLSLSYKIGFRFAVLICKTLVVSKLIH
ncbi:F-box/LRR-repeat protein [Spatholobus suberectus]|nr:F-box/LRR-repeat protein [Spatholobus suberectus]